MSHFLRALSTSQVVDPNIDKFSILRRALRTFSATFAGYENTDEETVENYTKHKKEFYDLMVEVFQLQGLNMDQEFQSSGEDLMDERISATFGVLSAKGIDKMSNPTVHIISCFPLSGSFEVVLDINNEKQDSTDPLVVTCLLDQFMGLRAHNHRIEIRFQAGNAIGFDTFILSYRQLSTEGFLDWFHFGNGVQLLIKIQISINEMDPQLAQKFHMYFILYILENRIRYYRSRYTPIPELHYTYGTKRTTSMIQKSVDPHTESAFWYKPAKLQTITDQDFRDFLETEGLFGRKAKYHELDIGIDFFDDYIKEDFCVCSEWCNLGAFFYHNPIFRFLMVMHNKLFMTNQQTRADLYLTITAHLMKFPSVSSVLKTPLFMILKSAKDYSQRNIQRYGTDQVFGALYGNSFLIINDYIGMTYNLMKNDIKPAVLALQNHERPFADSAIENIHLFNVVFNYLHFRIADIPNFVPLNGRDAWFGWLEKTSHDSYNSYLQLSFQKALANFKDFDFENLFSEDYELSLKYDQKEGFAEILKQRQTVMRLSRNPYNVRFKCNSFVLLIIKLHKYIAKILPSLPSLMRLTSFSNYQNIVTFIDGILESRTSAKNFNIKRCDTTIHQNPSLKQIEKQLYRFFTLKIYGMSFTIQKNFIYAIINCNRKYMHPDKCATQDLAFIYRNKWIETSFRANFPNDYVFLNETEKFKQTFDAFYENFWGKAEHEMQILDEIDVVLSVNFQYQRLYFWWKNNGNDKNIFKNILNTYSDILENIIQRSEKIFIEEIIGVFGKIRDNSRENMEVMDELVYMLVKADCFMIISTAANFLKQIHRLQDPMLVGQNQSFTFTKPGFVPLFRTLNTCLHYLQLLNNSYIVYNDQFNRISTVLTQTQLMLKEFYRDVYAKLANIWCKEIDDIYTNYSPLDVTDEDNYVNMIQFHLLVGMSFFTAFHENFRKQFVRTRKYIQILYDNHNQLTKHSRALLYYWNEVKNWFEEKEEVEKAMPFLSQTWQRLFRADFEVFDTLTPTQVRIDLNAANL